MMVSIFIAVIILGGGTLFMLAYVLEILERIEKKLGEAPTKRQ